MVKTVRNPRLSWPLEQRPGFLIRRMHQIHVALFQKECAAFDITPLQYSLLTALAARGTADQTTLAADVALDRTTTTGALKRLQLRNFIERSVLDAGSPGADVPADQERHRAAAEDGTVGADRPPRDGIRSEQGRSEALYRHDAADRDRALQGPAITRRRVRLKGRARAGGLTATICAKLPQKCQLPKKLCAVVGSPMTRHCEARFAFWPSWSGRGE